ncbi:MAG: leucine-rich repeat protein [Clostridiales bacterium]|nr:leucine-rich repeat protein [Clostridiales bacterium]
MRSRLKTLVSILTAVFIFSSLSMMVSASGEVLYQGSVDKNETNNHYTWEYCEGDTLKIYPTSNNLGIHLYDLPSSVQSLFSYRTKVVIDVSTVYEPNNKHSHMYIYGDENCTVGNIFVTGNANKFYAYHFSDLPSLMAVNFPKDTDILTLSIGSCGITSVPAAYKNAKVNRVEISGCDALTDVEIPEDVISFEIEQCRYVESIEIPETLRFLSVYDLPALTDIDVPETLISCYLEDVGITDIEVPVNPTFAIHSDSLEIATIKPGRYFIDSFMFKGCRNLSYVDIPDGVTTIEYSAFAFCYSLPYVSLPESVNNIYSGAFIGSGIYNMTIPSGVTTIEYATFRGCDNLEWIELPSTITKIDDTAFDDCYSLDDVVYRGTAPQFNKIKVWDRENDCVSKYSLEYIFGEAYLWFDDNNYIYIQPEDFEGSEGDTAVFTLKAFGNDQLFIWQYYDIYDDAWYDIEPVDPEDIYFERLELPVTENMDGMRLRCCVYNPNEVLSISDEVTITVNYPVRIFEQPFDVTCQPGDNAIFSVGAVGKGLKYQWQVFKNGTWTNCSVNDGAKTETLTLEAKDSRDGTTYQCVITDKFGNKETTKTVTLTVSTPLEIKTQPKDVSGYAGETATFTVKATGSGLKYQWQVLKNGTWTNCSVNDGAKTNKLTLEIKDSRNGSKYQCIVTDKHGATVTTNEVTLTVNKPLAIKKQPANVSGPEGDIAQFTVVAEGVNVKYQWQVYKNGAWTNCSVNDGAKTDTLSLEIKSSRDGTKYHCIVTDKSGSSLTTNEVTLSTSKELKIVSEPLPYFFAYEGYYEEITIEAQGDGLKYQWQVLKNGTWTNCSINDGAKTNTLKLEGKYSRFGSQYHCVVRDKYGNEVTSSIFTFYVYDVPGTQHPESEHDDPVPNPDVDPIHPPEDEELTEPVDAADIKDTVVTADVVDVVEVIDTAPEIVTETTFD